MYNDYVVSMYRALEACMMALRVADVVVVKFANEFYADDQGIMIPRDLKSAKSRAALILFIMQESGWAVDFETDKSEFEAALKLAMLSYAERIFIANEAGVDQ